MMLNNIALVVVLNFQGQMIHALNQELIQDWVP